MNEKYSGMTVNERLFASGLMKKFDKAVADKNTDRIIKILKSVELNESSINPILEKLGLINKKS